VLVASAGAGTQRSWAEVIGPHYAASKAALHGLMHHLAPRVAGSGVTVTTIAPALIESTWMLPGDPGCPPVDGFEAEERRFVLEGGRWRPVGEHG